MTKPVKIRRPALKYYGGKWRLAPWIISHFPTHYHYIEPCFGAGSVLLRKQPVAMETVNDLNGRVVNFFQVLRDRPNELIRLIDLTPWAEDEYYLVLNLADDPLEDARRFFVLSWMSFTGAPTPTGFRTRKTKRVGKNIRVAQDLVNHALEQIFPRLRLVQILNQDAIKFLKRFGSDPNSLIYFDPPYPQETRPSGQFRYSEFDYFDELHKPAAELLKACPGFVVISGYSCPEYADLYETAGWVRQDRITSASISNKRKVESLWLSPKTWDALREESEISQVALL